MSVFTERQKFNSLWGYLLFLLVAAANYFYMVTVGQGDNGVIYATLLTALAVLFIFEFSKLDTTITKQGISYKFWPYQRKESTLAWEEIQSIEIKEYKPIKDYGGWGVRMGFKKGRAFNTKGNFGMLIHLKDGKDIMIGTQRYKDLYTAIKNQNKSKVQLLIQ